MEHSSPSSDTLPMLHQLERAMVASIALMKRIRRERRRSSQGTARSQGENQ
jgi:hypothetical protein